MKTALVVVMVVVMGAVALGADDGVIRPSVEGLQARIVELEKQLAKAQEENKALRLKIEGMIRNAGGASATQAAADAKGREDASGAKLEAGMTLDEAKAAFPGEWVLESESGTETRYAVKWVGMTGRVGGAGGGRSGAAARAAETPVYGQITVAAVSVIKGRVDAFHIERERMKNILASGGGPRETKPARK